MKGEPETIYTTDNNAVVEVARGNRGTALVNLSSASQTVDALPTTLPDGDYTDSVSGNSFTVSDGKISGSLAPLTSYILYRN